VLIKEKAGHEFDPRNSEDDSFGYTVEHIEGEALVNFLRTQQGLPRLQASFFGNF